jgi:hypothetical protein
MLTTGKGTWAEVARLIQSEEWEHVFIITNDFGKEKFSCNKEHSFIIINPFDKISDIKNKIKTELKDKLSLEVALNFVSGTGKEHMALIGALFEMGNGIRLVETEEGKLKEI